MAKNRNELSLKQKVDPLKNSDGKNSRQLAEAYDVGCTRLQNILKRKHEIMEAFEDNGIGKTNWMLLLRDMHHMIFTIWMRQVFSIISCWTTLVMGKLEKPRCFKNINKANKNMWVN